MVTTCSDLENHGKNAVPQSLEPSLVSPLKSIPQNLEAASYSDHLREDANNFYT